MTITVNGANKVFETKQTLVVYQNGQVMATPFDNGVLAPNTKGVKYQSGMLLAQYTVANAPVPALAGMFVNYDSTSANLDQKVCVGILPTGYYDVSGIDLTTQETATATVNRVNVARLFAGLNLYNETIVAQNDPADVTAFNTDFEPKFVTNVYLNGAQSAIVQITK